MDKRLRPIPFPWGTAAWRDEYRRLRRERRVGDYIARFEIRHANRVARWTPLPGERCGAHAKSTGKPCMAKAWANGRCRVHGGLSTGAKTPEGKARVLANLKQHRNSPPPSENQD